MYEKDTAGQEWSHKHSAAFLSLNPIKKQQTALSRNTTLQLRHLVSGPCDIHPTYLDVFEQNKTSVIPTGSSKTAK